MGKKTRSNRKGRSQKAKRSTRKNQRGGDYVHPITVERWTGETCLISRKCTGPEGGRCSTFGRCKVPA